MACSNVTHTVAGVLQRGAKFCTVGAFVFGVDFGAIWLLKQFLPKLVAVSAAYLISVTVHFSLNKWWVFGGAQQFCPKELARYAVTVAACWVTTMLVVAAVLAWITDNVFTAKALALPPATVLGFVMMRFFVFRQR